MLNEIVGPLNRRSVMRHTMTMLQPDENKWFGRMPNRVGEVTALMLNSESNVIRYTLKANYEQDHWMSAPWIPVSVAFRNGETSEQIAQRVIANENLLWLKLALAAREVSNELRSGPPITKHVVSTSEEEEFCKTHHLKPMAHLEVLGDTKNGKRSKGSTYVCNATNYLHEHLASFPAGQVATVHDPLNHGFYMERDMRIEHNTVKYDLAAAIYAGSVAFAPYTDHPNGFGLEE